MFSIIIPCNSSTAKTANLKYQNVSSSVRFEHVLFASEDDDEKETSAHLTPTILQKIIDDMKNTVREVVAQQSKFPKEYIKDYDQFIYLIDGRAEAEIETYVQESHEFKDFSDKVKFFDNLGNTLISTLPKEVNLGMFELHCEDIISNLHRKTGILREQVSEFMSKWLRSFSNTYIYI